MSEAKSKAGLWVLLIKLGSKVIPFLIKSLKLLKFGKVGLAAATLAGYSVMFTWKFALLIMIAIGWHESGHVWAMKKLGIKTKGFYFVPFIGGAAVAEEEFKSYRQQVLVAIMGPIWGIVMAWASACLYWYTHNTLWAAAAGWMAMITAVNLLPVNPLDGGRIFHAIGSSISEKIGIWFLFASCAFSAIILWKLHIYLFSVLMVVGFFEAWAALIKRQRMQKYIDQIEKDWERLHLINTGDNKHLHIEVVAPEKLTKLQFIPAIGSYVVVVVLSLWLILLMKHIPGADIAANFLE